MKGSSSVWQCIWIVPGLHMYPLSTNRSRGKLTLPQSLRCHWCCSTLLSSLPLHFCFSPSLPSPLSHGHGFQYRSLILKRIILWIIIVLLQWLAVTVFLLPLPARRMPKGLPAQQQARRLLEGCCQHRPTGMQQHTLTSGTAASLPSALFFVSFQQFSKIVLLNRSRNFASCWASYVYFSSEHPFNLLSVLV